MLHPLAQNARVNDGHAVYIPSGVGTTGAAGARVPISFQLGVAAIEYSPPIIIAKLKYVL